MWGGELVSWRWETDAYTADSGNPASNAGTVALMPCLMPLPKHVVQRPMLHALASVARKTLPPALQARHCC